MVGIPVAAFATLYSQRGGLHLARANGAENLLFDETVLDALEEKIDLVVISNETALTVPHRLEVCVCV